MTDTPQITDSAQACGDAFITCLQAVKDIPDGYSEDSVLKALSNLGGQFLTLLEAEKIENSVPRSDR
jgi:hypothetical protein